MCRTVLFALPLLAAFACGEPPRMVGGEYVLADFEHPLEGGPRALSLAEDLSSAVLTYDGGETRVLTLSALPEGEWVTGCRDKTSSHQVDTLTIDVAPLEVGQYASAIQKPVLVAGCFEEPRQVGLASYPDGQAIFTFNLASTGN